MERLTEDDLGALLWLHSAGEGNWIGFCLRCKTKYPCDYARAVDEIVVLRERVKELEAEIVKGVAY